MPFELGRTYTRPQIAQEVGGGSLHDLFPNKDGKVLCACLSQAFDPADPVVLIGAGPGVQAQGEMFCQAAVAVPLFFKKEANLWEYAGEYSCKRSSEEPEDIERYEESSGRMNLTKIVFLQRSE